MNACVPKLLPWIASRSGIGQSRALNLWQRAAKTAELRCGCAEGSDFHADAMQGFLHLIEGESAAYRPAQLLAA